MSMALFLTPTGRTATSPGSSVQNTLQRRAEDFLYSICYIPFSRVSSLDQINCPGPLNKTVSRIPLYRYFRDYES